jgi:hypothetical protein
MSCRQTLARLKAQGRRVLRMEVRGASYRLTVEDNFRSDDLSVSKTERTL